MGQVIAGRFELGRPFESSAATEVFLARDRKRNQLVIVKVLKDKNSQEALLLQELLSFLQCNLNDVYKLFDLVCFLLKLHLCNLLL